MFTRRRIVCSIAAGLFMPSSISGLARAGSGRKSVESVKQLHSGAYDPRAIYQKMQDNGIELPAVNYHKLTRKFCRQIVADPTSMPPGTIVVHTDQNFLYLVQHGGKAIRYGVGVGRAGYAWAGSGTIAKISAWPRWTPTPQMRVRSPELKSLANGLKGGLMNPLGARALYIFQNGADTLYRVHGTPEWWSIGRSVSSGCIRMLNQDVIHLSSHVENGARIIVKNTGDTI